MKKSDICWQNVCENNSLPTPETFCKWINAALQTATVSENFTTIGLRFVDAEESRTLNKKFRNKDKPTNVLSFPNQPIPGDTDNSMGDLVFCCDIIDAEAKDRHTPEDEYWAHMCIHGVMHLLGYTHDNGNNARTMEQLESKCLLKLGYSAPY